jgi:hypothetical protein
MAAAFPSVRVMRRECPANTARTATQRVAIAACRPGAYAVAPGVRTSAAEKKHGLTDGELEMLF